MFVYLCINYAKNSGHPLFGTPTGPAKMFETANVRDSRKFKIFVIYKALCKSNTVFTSALTLVSLKDSRREKNNDNFTVIGILLSVE